MRKDDAGVLVVQFFGWLLVAAGGLIVLTSGACSALFFVSSLSHLPSLGGSLMMILMFGGIPFAVGLGVFALGRFLTKVGEVKQRPRRRIADEGDDSTL